MAVTGNIVFVIQLAKMKPYWIEVGPRSSDWYPNSPVDSHRWWHTRERPCVDRGCLELRASRVVATTGRQ